MKKLLLVVVALAVVAVANNKSYSQPGKISFGIGADVGLPMGTFGDTQGIGIGGSAKVYYALNEMATLTGTAGYMTFSGKDITVGTVTVTAGKWSMVPVTVGGRYYFSPAGSNFRAYGAFDLGMVFGSYTINIPEIKFGTIVIQPASSSSVSTSDFTYQPQLGFEAGKFDVAVRLLGVANANTVAVRVGYIFR